MSRQRRDKQQVEACNKLLGQELGRNPHGLPVYSWKYSEDWTRTKRVMYLSDLADELIPEFDYKGDTETGILRAVPKYTEEKVCLDLVNQWIMSVWIKPESFDEWRANYGDALEWPKHGDFWPVSHPTGVVCLEPCVVPTVDITWEFIHAVRHSRKLSEADFEAQYDAAQKSRDDAMKDRMMGTLMNVLPVYFGIPGSRSFPNWMVGATKLDGRIANPDKIFKGQ